jgi:hypothetical protein
MQDDIAKLESKNKHISTVIDRVGTEEDVRISKLFKSSEKKPHVDQATHMSMIFVEQHEEKHELVDQSVQMTFNNEMPV